jgi:hypothetical protein
LEGLSGIIHLDLISNLEWFVDVVYRL